MCPDRFFFALFSLFRNSLSIGLLERPLVIGLFWGVFTGEYTTAINISILFELFWLDLIPAGTFIPPHITASTFSTLALVHWFDLKVPTEILTVILLSMPLAWLGAKIEIYLRERQRVSYNRLLNWARKPDDETIPGTLILKSIITGFISSWLFLMASLLVLKQVVELVINHFPDLLTNSSIGWPHLWIAASLGGVMALRLKRAYVVLILGTALVLFFSIWPVFSWQW